MSRRRRDSRPVDAGHGTARERAEFRAVQRYGSVLRRLQLASAVVMLLGLATLMLVLFGEFKILWLALTGGGVFGFGLILFAVARPLARRWTRVNENG